jgi:hypothetical protein
MRKSSRKLALLKKDESPQDPSLAKKKGSPPGRSLETVEDQLIGLANTLARKQMVEGTASAQVITHFLKLGSSLAKLETEKLEHENSLLAAKTDVLKSQKKMDELYSEAIKAMRMYGGGGPAFVEGQVVDGEVLDD